MKRAQPPTWLRVPIHLNPSLLRPTEKCVVMQKMGHTWYHFNYYILLIASSKSGVLKRKKAV
jgi:hypothetical protein